MKHFFFLLALGLVSCASSPKMPPNPWAEMPGPSSGPAEAIGSYERGCLAGGVALPDNSPGLQIMRPGRRRFYGHPSLIAFLERLGHDTVQAGIPWLLVGDLAHPRGGPHFQGHRSHQTGLDVDLWFWVPETATTLSREERETVSARSMVNGSALDPGLWKASRQPILLRMSASSPSVERIFVAPLIKKNLCQEFGKDPANTPWLRKIRPWWGHEDHFHVRLFCPASNPHCKVQAPIASGNGCDASLDWWFSEEARQEAVKQAEIAAAKAKTFELPELPVECKELLNPLR